MYKCRKCGQDTVPRQSLLRLNEYRELKDGRGTVRKEIEREIPVCVRCYDAARPELKLQEESVFENKMPPEVLQACVGEFTSTESEIISQGIASQLEA